MKRARNLTKSRPKKAARRDTRPTPQTASAPASQPVTAAGLSAPGATRRPGEMREGEPGAKPFRLHFRDGASAPRIVYAADLAGATAHGSSLSGAFAFAEPCPSDARA